MDYLALGKILSTGRKAVGLRQQDAADRVGVTFQNVSSWERGKSKIDIETLSALCDLYGLSLVNTLLTVTDKKPATGGASDGFSDAERGLIELFRLLTPEQQDMVIQVVQVAAERQKSQ